MANEIEHFDEAGLILYARPLPLVVSPWGGDAVVLSDSGAVGYYTSDIDGPADVYVIYRQVGESPAPSDRAIAQVRQPIGVPTAEEIRAELDSNSTKLAEIVKIPRSGKTYKYTNTTEGGGYTGEAEHVKIEEAE